MLRGRSSGIRSLARSVRSSASVKSSVNQPVNETPSITLVVRRPANSGWSATSVVPEISFSWRATSTPSFVETRSGSMYWAPIARTERVGGQGVLRAIPRGAAVGDHEGLGVLAAPVGGGGAGHGGGQDQ